MQGSTLRQMLIIAGGVILAGVGLAIVGRLIR